MAEGTRTSIEPGMIARAVAGLRYALTGKAPEWMSPLSPLEPVTTPEEQEGIRGRAFDFPVGFNTRVTPRQGEAIGFAEMRALADGYDLMRLVIESRKDQLSKLRFVVKPKDEKAKGLEAKCAAAFEFLQFPDRENSWHDWLRMLVEDMLVIDAATIYPRMTRGGSLYALELVDGATITRKIDETGRTPLPPETAYQQVLKGLPAVDYTLDELIYAPRNKRTHKVYGYSPVEQVIMTVNIALRRQMHQLQYYTEGSTPDLIFQVPESWNPDQIRQFQVWWNGMLAGNTGTRRGTMFVPNGVSPIDTKSQILKDEYDEWLARVICYAFSISPQAFVKEMNRATAETALQQALAEGLQPVMNWVKTLLDSVILRFFGSEIEFAWEGDKELDPKQAAEIHQIYISSGVLTVDEVRADLGREPMTDAQREQIAAAKPQPPALPGAENPPQDGEGEKSAPSEKLAKGHKTILPLDQDRIEVAAPRAKMAKIVEDFFKGEAKRIAAYFVDSLGKSDDENLQRALNELDLSGWVILTTNTAGLMEDVAKAGVSGGFAQISVSADLDAFNLANADAVEYAATRSAEMVGMKWVGGELVPNPSAKWQITETTRQSLRTLIERAMQEGWSNDRLSQEILESETFSPSRAEMIARTETAYADSEGSLAAWKRSNAVKGKEWLAAPGCCNACADLNGKQASLEGEFPGGYRSSPAHPHCRCAIIPVLIEDKRHE